MVLTERDIDAYHHTRLIIHLSLPSSIFFRSYLPRPITSISSEKTDDQSLKKKVREEAKHTLPYLSCVARDDERFALDHTDATDTMFQMVQAIPCKVAALREYSS